MPGRGECPARSLESAPLSPRSTPRDHRRTRRSERDDRRSPRDPAFAGLAGFQPVCSQPAAARVLSCERGGVPVWRPRGKWKYTFEATSGREFLTDLTVDPDELQNVAEFEPDVCNELRQRVAAWVDFEDKFIRRPH